MPARLGRASYRDYLLLVADLPERAAAGARLLLGPPLSAAGDVRRHLHLGQAGHAGPLPQPVQRPANGIRSQLYSSTQRFSMPNMRSSQHDDVWSGLSSKRRPVSGQRRSRGPAIIVDCGVVAALRG